MTNGLNQPAQGGMLLTPGGLWVTESSTDDDSASQRSAMLNVFVPHDAVFSGLANDLAEFKRLLRSLSRTDAIFWCARLNILISDAVVDPVVVQSRCIRVFFDDDAISKINSFVAGFGGAERASVFFRGQLLELLRWVTLLCPDSPNDGATFDDAEVRRTFARAALLAGDIWGRRVYGSTLDRPLPIKELRQEVLPAIRRMSLENTPCPDPVLLLARGASLFVDSMRSRAPDVDQAFHAATDLSVDDYFAMLVQLAVDCLFPVRTAEGFESLLNPAKGGLFQALSYEQHADPVGSIARNFLAREAQTADQLRQAFWGGVDDADEATAREFDLRIIRDRPIFRAGDGRSIIIDPRLFIERGSAGPLFSLVRGTPKTNPQRWFALFGDVFEDHAKAIMGRIYPDGDGLARRFFPKPDAIDADSRKSVDLGDGLLLGADSAALFEMKAAWTPDSTVGPDADGSSYMAALRSRYGISENPREGDRPVKGLGQLARTVSRLCDSSWIVRNPPLDAVRTLFPILVVHDPHVNSPVHSHILAREFAAYLGINEPEKGAWSRLARGRFAIAHVITLTLDDLEILEPSSRHFALLECFDAYDRACPDRIVSFHNFLATSPYREKLRANDWLASRALELLDKCRARLFPNSPQS